MYISISDTDDLLKALGSSLLAQTLFFLLPLTPVPTQPVNYYIFKGRYTKRLYSKDGMEKLSFSLAIAKLHVFSCNFSRLSKAAVIR